MRSIDEKDLVAISGGADDQPLSDQKGDTLPGSGDDVVDVKRPGRGDNADTASNGHIGGDDTNSDFTP